MAKEKEFEKKEKKSKTKKVKKERKPGYLKEVNMELKKVTFPTLKDVVKYTFATILFCVVLVCFFLLLNLLLSGLKGMFYLEKLWYVVNTYSGHEESVKEKLEMRTESMGMQDYIYRVIVPETTEIEIKDGVKKEKKKKMFPGYVIVEMIMSDEAWYIVRNTPGVTGFIGSSGKGAKPTPLLPQEIDRILANMGMSRMDLESELAVGDKVNIVDGPFKGMMGTVDTIDLENSRLNVLIDLFGQETPVEVELYQVNKC